MLELALINWTLSQLLSKGFVPLSTPDLVRSTVVEKCGFQPRGQNTQVSPHLHLPLQTRVLSYSANCQVSSIIWLIKTQVCVLFIAGIFSRGNRSLSGRHCRDSCWWDVYGQYVTRGIITIETCCIFTLFSNRSWCCRCCNQVSPCLLHNSIELAYPLAFFKQMHCLLYNTSSCHEFVAVGSMRG